MIVKTDGSFAALDQAVRGQRRGHDGGDRDVQIRQDSAEIRLLAHSAAWQ